MSGGDDLVLVDDGAGAGVGPLLLAFAGIPHSVPQGHDGWKLTLGGWEDVAPEVGGFGDVSVRGSAFRKA